MKIHNLCIQCLILKKINKGKVLKRWVRALNFILSQVFYLRIYNNRKGNQQKSWNGDKENIKSLRENITTSDLLTLSIILKILEDYYSS